MTREDAIDMAERVFKELERKGIQPLDDNDWMNPEDRAAIVDPFAEAILAAYQHGVLGIPVVSREHDYTGVAYCDHCEKETQHEIHDSGHERDSSGDWQVCLTCGARWSGMTGEYGPPKIIQTPAVMTYYSE